jgi:signal transduction histidine kinase
LHQRQWQVLAVLAFGAPLAAIALVQYRWLQELSNRSRQAESQQNRVTVLSAAAMLEDRMAGARLETLPPIVHEDVLELRLDALGPQFEDALQRFPYVEHFFVWVAPAPPGETLFYFPDEKDFRAIPGIADLWPSEVWQMNGDSPRWAEFSIPGDPSVQVVLHRMVHDDDPKKFGLVGFCVNLERFAMDYLPLFHAESVVPFLGQTGREDVPFAVFDEQGRNVFGSKAGLDPRLADSSAEIQLAFALPSEGAGGAATAPVWRLTVGERRYGVQELLKQGTLSNLAIVGAGIVVLGLGAMLIARSSTREAKLSDLKSRFISGISHELKTPLSMLRLYAEMLELGRVPDETERKLFYKKLRQQAETMGDMLDEILDFSRLEAEQQPLRKEPCPPEEILEEAVDMLEASGSDRTKVTFSTAGSLPKLLCNRPSLVRAVYNLLDNAFKYSDSDQPVEVRAARRNGMVEVAVVDHGRGISSEDLPHIFERFYRGETSKAVKGTGLGLSIVDTVVKAHQGRVEVESKPGRGSSFTILLPVPPQNG